MAKKKSFFRTVIETVKELRKTERGKAILFFGGYFIFFVLVFIFINLGKGDLILPEDYELNSTTSYTFDKILAENYSFVYTINTDGNTVVYSGKKLGAKELFTVNGFNYYCDGDNYFVDNGGTWIPVSNPYVYPDFLNFVRLGQAIADATYISKTEFGSGVVLYNYQVSSNSLIKKIEDVDVDIMEIPNGIVFTALEDTHLSKIELDLSSYGKFKDICIDTFKITLEYSDFGEVSEIVANVS